MNIRESIVLEKGEDILFISSGAILSECLKASNELRKKNINCSVVNMHTIKPIDENIINKYSTKIRRAIGPWAC